MKIEAPMAFRESELEGGKKREKRGARPQPEESHTHIALPTHSRTLTPTG